jgi:hypothetical protein
VRSQRGFGYLEVLLALVVVASAVSAAGLALQSHALGRRDAAQHELARELVAAGLTLARSLPIVDPEMGVQGGREAGEAQERADDVGDLDGWVESAPRDALGQLIGVGGEWSRAFAVERVSSVEPQRLDPRGALLRIRVAALRGARVVAEGVCWRAGER